MQLHFCGETKRYVCFAHAFSHCAIEIKLLSIFQPLCYRNRAFVNILHLLSKAQFPDQKRPGPGNEAKAEDSVVTTATIDTLSSSFLKCS